MFFDKEWLEIPQANRGICRDWWDFEMSRDFKEWDRD